MGQLTRNREFINFILQAIYEQQAAVINTITPEQTEVLTEIFHNLQILPVNREEQKVLKKYKHIISVIAKADKSVRTRRRVIKKHKRIILQTLGLFREKLLDVVQQLSQ